MMYTRHLVLVPFILVFALGTAGLGAMIDFESIPPETPVRDQFLAQGLRIESPDITFGVVYSKGTHRVPLDFPSSGTQVFHTGANYNRRITMWFVDPRNPSTVLGTKRPLSFVYGSNVETEPLYIEMLRMDGSPVRGVGLPGFGVHDVNLFREFGQPEQIYGISIGSTSFLSSTRVVLDDLTFKLVPEPAAGSLAIVCLLTLPGGLAWRSIGAGTWRRLLRTIVPFAATIPLVVAALFPTTASALTIDFESIASGTPVREQYRSQGVRFRPWNAGSTSGTVYEKGTHGVPLDFESSGTKVLYLGDDEQPLVIEFVQPHGPYPLLGTKRLSFWLGEASPLIYTFGSDFSVNGQAHVTQQQGAMKYYDLYAGPGPHETVYGLYFDSPSQRVFLDDLSVAFVPEPQSIGLAMNCLLALFGAIGFYRAAKSLRIMATDWSRCLVSPVIWFTAAVPAAAEWVTIDFESIPSETLVRDQLLSQGIRVEGRGGPAAGIVYEKGTHGIAADFPSSGTQVFSVGYSPSDVRISFFDPDDSSKRKPVGHVLFTALMQPPPPRGFWVEFNDIDDNVITAGEILAYPNVATADSDDFYPTDQYLIGSMYIEGPVAIDDLRIQFVPEPATSVVVLMGVFAMFGRRAWLRRRYGHAP
jgi:hypothetical protein